MTGSRPKRRRPVCVDCARELGLLPPAELK